MATNNDETTDATLTEYLAARDVEDPSIGRGAAAIAYVKDGRGLWTPDDADGLDEDPAEYRVECSCGDEFGSWGQATRHVEEDH